MMWLQLFFISIFGCTSSLSTSFDLGGVISGNRMAGVPLGRSLGSGELDVEGVCDAPGMACQNCTHSVTCVPLPRGWLKIPLQQCPSGLTCNAHEGKCSQSTVPECDVIGQKYQHTCEQVGIFPDAWDCRKFHFCAPPEDVPDGRPADLRMALCPRGYGYHPKTAQCSVKLHKGQCKDKPLPDCTTLGQMGVMPSSPSHYYVCTMRYNQLFPQLFVCPHGWFFSEGFCRPEEVRITTEKISEIWGRNTEKTTEVLDGTTDAIETTKKYIPTKIETFFSTEKSTTFPPDAFLADKFDLTNYETMDDNVPDDFANSFENGYDFWLHRMSHNCKTTYTASPTRDANNNTLYHGGATAGYGARGYSPPNVSPTTNYHQVTAKVLFGSVTAINDLSLKRQDKAEPRERDVRRSH